MVRLPRGSAAVRTLALLLLVWVGLDVGLHGFFASDCSTISVGGATAVVDGGSGIVAAHASPDHCFCHSVSVGALRAPSAVFLALSGEAGTIRCPAAPHRDPHPLDQPPRLSA
jgi:hypothetical protein